jgi:hypothetical protein
MVGEHHRLPAEQTWADPSEETFSIISIAFCGRFAQEVKAEVGFSTRKIGDFGQTGVFKFSLSSSSAKGFSQLAEQ